MRLAGFVALVSASTTPQHRDDVGRRYGDVMQRCYDEVARTAKYLAHPSGRSPMDTAAFEAVKDCAEKYLK
jgi:hypothetical protein